MDRILRRQLDAIARDRTSGAAEITRVAAQALTEWLHRMKGCRADDLLEVAHGLHLAQPTMAPLLRLSNEMALAADAFDRHIVLNILAAYRQRIARAPSTIATRFRRKLPRRQARVLTYSYSSTVQRALTAAQGRIRTVVCSESRPGGEGRETAARLASAGIRVQLVTDAELFSGVLCGDYVVVGADSVLSDGFVNKRGTSTLLHQAWRIGAHVWILADTTKYWPEECLDLLFRTCQIRRWGRPRTIWKDAPKGVYALYNTFSLFEPTWFDPRMRLLSERGWMNPAQVRREIARIELSPRLKDLAD